MLNANAGKKNNRAKMRKDRRPAEKKKSENELAAGRKNIEMARLISL
jgi:hypothetical protein